MSENDSIVAIFQTHASAETGIRSLAAAGFDMKNLSIVGKGYHTEEKVVGFYNVGERVDFWAKQGAYWGGLCGLFLGGMFVAIPVAGGVVILGYLTSVLVSALEGALVGSGVSALGAALYSVGVPEDSVIQYEAALKANSFLIIVHGDVDDIARAEAVLAGASPLRLEMHSGARGVSISA